jgi:hypothetical protein
MSSAQNSMISGRIAEPKKNATKPFKKLYNSDSNHPFKVTSSVLENPQYSITNCFLHLPHSTLIPLHRETLIVDRVINLISVEKQFSW